MAEYPVEGPLPAGAAESAVPDKSLESKPGTNLSTSITLTEIQRDRLTKIAAANWAKTGDFTSAKKPFSPQLVKEIYDNELTVKGKGFFRGCRILVN